MTAEIPQLHADYLAGRRSPVEVTRWALDQAAAANPSLNAFTCLLPERALAEAAAAADRYRRGVPRSVLDGVPVSVKDLIHVAGAPTTSASDAASGGAERRDAAVVRRLSEAGAVIYAKTNLLEFAYGVVHPSFGPAHNPYDLSRSSSGSSSGAGVAVAAGLGFVAIGTDTAGSVRDPAAWCGVVGLKPTHGLVDAAGVVPLAPSLDHVGPLCRSVEDCRLSMEVLAGRPLRVAASTPPRVGVVTLPHTTDDVREAVDALVAALAADGARVEAAPPFDWRLGNAACLVTLYGEALEVHAARLPARWGDYSLAMRSRVLAGWAVSGADYVRAQAVRRDLAASWARMMERFDVLVGPTLPAVAMPEGDLGELADATLYTASQALLGVPALSVPAGLGRRSGLPVGLQVSGARGGEAWVLEVAARLEALRGPLRRPPAYWPPLPS